MADTFEKMDRMYRVQRRFYDVTRKFYLLGRDRLLVEMPTGKAARVLEIGCGTGRNLIALARKNRNTAFYGLDASAAMLETARGKINRRKIVNIKLAKALAEDFSFRETFALNELFDLIFFSYSISMIPNWKKAIHTALENLQPGASVYIVDFYDQRDLPAWFRRILQRWLKLFHVAYPRELLPFLYDLEKRGMGQLLVKPLFKSYSFIAEFRKN